MKIRIIVERSFENYVSMSHTEHQQRILDVFYFMFLHLTAAKEFQRVRKFIEEK